METYERPLSLIFLTVLLFSLFLLSSCADRTAPSPEMVQKLFGNFFEEQGFRMVSLELGNIEGAPLAQKTYGKKRAYYVMVRRIVLEVKGQQVVRENSLVIIREKPGVSKEWVVEKMPAELVS